MTAWDLYQLIPAPAVTARHGTCDKYAKERWGLYNAYAEKDSSDISNFLALQSASDKHTATVQAQVLVQ